MSEPDFSKDYLSWFRVETVTVYPSPRNDRIRFPVQSAKRRALTRRDLARDNGTYSAQDLVWWLPVATSQRLTGPYSLQRGFVIEDKNLTPWTVLEVQLGKLQNSWRLVCRNLVLSHALADLITILRPSVTIGAAGEPVGDWNPPNVETIVSNLPARVQPTGGSLVDVADAETTSQGYTVILGQAVDLQAHDRIVWNGKSLQYLRTSNEGRIDELPAVECATV